MTTYDPYKLIEQVREPVQASGAEIQPTDERAALIGASQLPRSMGVFPAVDAADFYTRGHPRPRLTTATRPRTATSRQASQPRPRRQCILVRG